ncbi:MULTISPECIES: oxidoreductase [Cupriavidus]|uniref:SDR family NAD(P)-dependent oxidoreductase n=1 Tax=Cupriavidus pauculus TaxID=82633 RepID=A0A5P2HAE6_9BURK|nr:oxidoreductase [Cupriavidus pauculus]QET04415.1 SDR family NAD(P)-dependent oxidoreductase [Cupriavidus pauculus]
MSQTDTPVWLITGCSTGLGRALAGVILDKGWRVVVTARDVSSVADIVQRAEDRALALTLDVTSPADVQAAVTEAVARFGQIDVLVNNAGYGYQSTVEEGEDAEIRAQFDANVFGLFSVTRAVLPHMRARRRGNIINITSVAGFIGFAGSGYYAASKHAVEGWSDSLRAEVAPLGIGVTCIEPGPFRTDWAGRSLRQTQSKITDYADTAGKRLAGTKQASGTQAGDPVRAGEAMVAIARNADAPRHLVLGAWGFDTVVQDLHKRVNEIESQRDLSRSADYDA